MDSRSTPWMRREGRTLHSRSASRDSSARLQVRLRHLHFAYVDETRSVSFAHQNTLGSGYGRESDDPSTPIVQQQDGYVTNIGSVVRRTPRRFHRQLNARYRDSGTQHVRDTHLESLWCLGSDNSESPCRDRRRRCGPAIDSSCRRVVNQQISHLSGAVP